MKNIIMTRQKNYKNQCSFFSRYPDLFEIPFEKENFSTAWLAFPVLIKESAPFSRREFQIYLEKRAIQTRVVFTGNILRQPMCKNIDKKVTSRGLKNSDDVMKRGVLLPLHHGMTDSMFERLHETIERFLKQL